VLSEPEDGCPVARKGGAAITQCRFDDLGRVKESHHPKLFSPCDHQPGTKPSFDKILSQGSVTDGKGIGVDSLKALERTEVDYLHARRIRCFDGA